MYKQLEMYFAEWNYEDFNLQLIPVIEHVSTCTFKCQFSYNYANHNFLSSHDVFEASLTWNIQH